jgi:uncharacterized protein YecT (DUF1311 family)
VTGMASEEPNSVQRIIGTAGELLRGPYVVSLEEGGIYEPVHFPRTSGPSRGERIFGLMIRYTRQVTIASDGELLLNSSPDSSAAQTEDGKNNSGEGGSTSNTQSVTATTSPSSRVEPNLDCARVSRPSEKIVCSNAELSAEDARVSQLYKTALSRAAYPDAVIDEQRTWLEERNACASLACLETSYRRRLSDLVAFTSN